jgi:hypothetical protein
MPFAEPNVGLCRDIKDFTPSYVVKNAPELGSVAIMTLPTP